MVVPPSKFESLVSFLPSTGQNDKTSLPLSPVTGRAVVSACGQRITRITTRSTHRPINIVSSVGRPICSSWRKRFEPRSSELRADEAARGLQAAATTAVCVYGISTCGRYRPRPLTDAWSHCTL